MISKTKFLIIIVAVLGFVLLVYSPIQYKYWRFEYFFIAKVLYIIGVAGIVPYFFFKNWRKIIIKAILFIFSISFTISVYLLFEEREIRREVEIATKYENSSCDELKEFFATDLKNKEVKFFQYGMGTDIELYKHLKFNYNIELFGMGCMKFPSVDCYNDLVNKYLIEKHKDSILNDW